VSYWFDIACAKFKRAQALGSVLTGPIHEKSLPRKAQLSRYIGSVPETDTGGLGEKP